MKNQIFSAIKVSALAVILSFGLSSVYAWTAPTATPPTGNVSAPINTSLSIQTKAIGGDICVEKIAGDTKCLSNQSSVTRVQSGLAVGTYPELAAYNSALCPTGKKVVGGGCFSTYTNGTSYPYSMVVDSRSLGSNVWLCGTHNTANYPYYMYAIAQCI